MQHLPGANSNETSQLSQSLSFFVLLFLLTFSTNSAWVLLFTKSVSFWLTQQTTSKNVLSSQRLFIWNSFLNFLFLETGAQCASTPRAPANGRMKCASGACQISCLPDYKFSNGEAALTLVCDNGRWLVQNFNTNDIPACERNYLDYPAGFVFDQLILNFIFPHVLSCLSSSVQEQRNLHCTGSV